LLLQRPDGHHEKDESVSTWSDHSAHVNGIDVHYWQTGGDPEIMLLHGLTDSGRCWRRTADALSSEYGILMPDARGHGLSSAPESGYRVEDRVADALALLDALGIERIVVWGHSMGAATAAQLAASAPERVRAVILEDPPYLERMGDPPQADQWAEGLRQQQALSIEELAAWGREHMPTWSPDTLELWAEAKHQTRLQVFEYVRNPPTPWQSFIGNMSAPTLLITGEPERGAIVSPELAAQLQGMAPALQVAQITGAGHCIRYEQFDAYMAAARSFLHEML
jgi:pimeloyl-ACP methyl ester carboxylesterase